MNFFNKYLYWFDTQLGFHQYGGPNGYPLMLSTSVYLSVGLFYPLCWALRASLNFEKYGIFLGFGNFLELLQWLFSFLLYPSQAHFPQSILDVNVTHISVSYLFSISTLSESFSTSMAPDVTSLQVTSKPTFNWCFLQFTLESTSMSTC